MTNNKTIEKIVNFFSNMPTETHGGTGYWGCMKVIP
jgi:hypothetical protein